MGRLANFVTRGLRKRYAADASAAFAVQSAFWEALADDDDDRLDGLLTKATPRGLGGYDSLCDGVLLQFGLNREGAKIIGFVVDSVVIGRDRIVATWMLRLPEPDPGVELLSPAWKIHAVREGDAWRVEPLTRGD